MEAMTCFDDGAGPNFAKKGWNPSQFRKSNPVFSNEYTVIREIIVEARKEAGIIQRQLALGIGKAPSHLSLVERGQRRIDVLELYYIAQHLELGFVNMAGRIAERIRLQGCGAGVEI